jgi:hypothetical protein
MQQNIKKLAIVFAIALAAFLTPKQSFAQHEDVNFQVFYDALSPYGQWVDYKSYGYVWIPDVGSDFVPYSTSGYWVLTDYGWTWVSDYEWGWAPFHYGRWNYDNYYGWLWVPDSEWGPSWVNWRRADGYYGWSPMEPGSSITLSIGMPYDRYNDHWMFVREMDFERHDIHRYSVNQSEHANIFRRSAVINTTYIDNSRHTTYVSGPSRSEVQRVTGRRINPVGIQENNRPGRDVNDGKLNVYRPQVTRNNAVGQKPAPGRVENIKDVKRPSERNASPQPRNVTPQNNNIFQPSTPVKTNPAGRSDQQLQQGLKPQNGHVQQQQATPAVNSDRQKQQNARPQNGYPQQQPQPHQQANPMPNNNRQPQQNQRPQNANPQQQQQPQQQANPMPNNNRQPQQNQRPQNTNPQPQQQPQQHAAPAVNNERPPQQNTRPQNTNPQPQQQPQQHAAPAVNTQKQQKQQIQKQNEQEKEKRDGDAKKQSN